MSTVEESTEDKKENAEEDDGDTQVAAENGDDQKAAENSETNDNGPGETDLVMREGFPALRIPGTKFMPMVEGEEPIPRHSFWASEDVISFHPDHLGTLRGDCETVFTARDKPDGQAYSAGQTFFLPSKMKPRCALEEIVKTIFQKHVQHLEEGMYNPEQSGAEWWTLVLDADEEKNESAKKSEDDEEADEVGLHFDADYELEEQASNILLHPRLATVTYLSDYGAPTLILDKKSPPMDDLKKKTLEDHIAKAWLSHPKLGKHTVFDGRLLHGAPALYFPSRKHQDGEPAAKRQKVDKKRYTLLVNIWLNHWVLDAALLDEEVCSKLKTPYEHAESNLKGDDSYTPPFVWNDKIDLAKPVEAEKFKLQTSKVDPAGEDEIALCNHNVTFKYNPTMDECHKASALGPTVELELDESAFTLHVGDELPDATDDEAEDED
jgi:hypothetical protein